MAVYNILLIALTAAGVPLCKKGYTRFYLGIVFLTLFTMATIRRTTGYDYNLYAGWYNTLIIQGYDWISAWSREKGVTVPLKILTIITRDYQFMFAAISLAITSGIAVYIYKFSSKAYISVAAFISFGLFYNSLNFMRQFIAAIIVSFAFKYIHEKQPLRYLVMVMFASCFHYSALLLIPFWFILRIKMNWVVLGCYTVFAVLSFVFSVPIIEFVTTYFYQTYNPLTSEHMLVGLPAGYTLIFAAPFVMFFLTRNELIRKRGFNSVLINAYFFAVYFQFIGIKHSIISRFALLFMIAPILALIPDFIAVIADKLENETNERRRVLKAFAVFAFCFFAVVINVFFLSRNYNGVIPYSTIFN